MKERSQPMILLSIFDDIIVNKVIYSSICVEPCFKFSILSCKSLTFYTFYIEYILSKYEI